MALSRKYLKGMGLTEEQVSAIIEANEETITGLTDKIEKLQSANKEVERKFNNLQSEYDSLKESTDTSKTPYKKKYEEELAAKEQLQHDFDSYKAGVEEEKAIAKKSDAYRKLLKDAGINDKRIDSVLKVSPFKDVEFEEDGETVKDKDKLIESIKDDWSDFIMTKEVQGATVAHPIVNKQSEKKVSRAAELAAKYHANLYGEPKKGE